MDSQEPRTFPVLVVEDSPDDVLFIRRAFSKARLVNPLQFAEDGEQAIAYLSGTGGYADRTAHPLPMLILLDLKLPRLSGLEFLAWLRGQQPDLRRIPVVVLTSSRESSDVNRAYELGASTYLVKPVSFDGLLELVKQLGIYWMMLAELPSQAIG
jgi:CheY-like chemotaxis protein